MGQVKAGKALVGSWRFCNIWCWDARVGEAGWLYLVHVISLFKMCLVFLFGAVLYSSLASAVALQPQPPENNNMDLASLLIVPGLENLTIPLSGLFNDTISNAVNPPVTCFTQATDPAIARHDTVDLVDCVALFPVFILRPNVLDIVRWNTSDLPKTYTVRSCQVMLSAKAQNARDTFPEVLILHRVALILKEYFQRGDLETKFGGKVTVGERQAFTVSVSHP